MIEKLKKQNTWGECLEKLNELIDVINALVEENNIHEKQIDELQMKIEPEKRETPAENVQPDAESRPENVQDKFAEQRKWIGCLVRYKICDWQGGWCVDVLDEIVDHPIYPFKMRNGDTAAVCEVVEPSEIYPNKARTW